MGAWGKWNIDVGRHEVESLPPTDYLSMSYYEKWLAGLAGLLVDRGVLTLDDLRGAGEDGPHPLADKMLRAEAVAAALAKGGPADRGKRRRNGGGTCRGEARVT